jgi:hypothetical protein
VDTVFSVMVGLRWYVLITLPSVPPNGGAIQPTMTSNGDQLMSPQHVEGCIPSRIMSPWLSSSFGDMVAMSALRIISSSVCCRATHND